MSWAASGFQGTHRSHRATFKEKHHHQQQQRSVFKQVTIIPPNDDAKPDDAVVKDATHNDAAPTNTDNVAAADAGHTAIADDVTNDVEATHDVTVHAAATAAVMPGTAYAADEPAISTLYRNWDGIIHEESLLTVRGRHTYSLNNNLHGVQKILFPTPTPNITLVPQGYKERQRAYSIYHQQCHFANAVRTPTENK